MNEPQGDPQFEQFENYLREFQPRKPRSLMTMRSPRPLLLHRLAAAAVLATSCASALLIWHQRPSSQHAFRPAMAVTVYQPPVEPRARGLFAWSRLALDDPEDCGRALDEEARRSLPRFNHSQSALSALAKE